MDEEDSLLLTDNSGKRIYACAPCRFSTHNKKDFEKHKLTNKHKRNNEETNEETNHKCDCGKEFKHSSSLSRHKNTCIQRKYKCDCGKEYNARNSYWYHKKKCEYLKDENTENNNQDILIDMMKAIQHQQNQINDIIEILKNK